MKSLDDERFGRLTAIRPATKDEDGHRCGAHFLCQCDCGQEVIVRKSSLISGDTRSCGCLKRDVQTKHRSVSGNPACWGNLYSVWKGMMSRCYQVNDKDYPKYGGRGIVVCRRWHDFISFESEVGKRPEGTSLDRIDVNGNYEPANCRWATAEVQQRNRRCNRILHIEGEGLTLAEVCQRHHIAESTLRNRLDKGMSPSVAISLPVRRKGASHA